MFSVLFRTREFTFQENVPVYNWILYLHIWSHLFVIEPGDKGKELRVVRDDTLQPQLAALLHVDVRVPEDPHLWPHHHHLHFSSPNRISKLQITKQNYRFLSNPIAKLDINITLLLT